MVGKRTEYYSIFIHKHLSLKQPSALQQETE